RERTERQANDRGFHGIPNPTGTTWRGTERTSLIWEGCRANPRAVSMAVLDAGRLLYLCMEKSNRRENVNGKKREKGIAERYKIIVK
ncbi:hypothetical protein ABH116_25330, partial [Bacteroides ovatus]